MYFRIKHNPWVSFPTGTLRGTSFYLMPDGNTQQYLQGDSKDPLGYASHSQQYENYIKEAGLPYGDDIYQLGKDFGAARFSKDSVDLFTKPTYKQLEAIKDYETYYSKAPVYWTYQGPENRGSGTGYAELRKFISNLSVGATIPTREERAAAQPRRYKNENDWKYDVWRASGKRVYTTKEGNNITAWGLTPERKVARIGEWNRDSKEGYILAHGAREYNNPMRLKDAQKLCRDIGCTLTKNEYGEYRVNYKGGKESTSYYADDLDDAVETARAMSVGKSMRGGNMRNPVMGLSTMDMQAGAYGDNSMVRNPGVGGNNVLQPGSHYQYNTLLNPGMKWMQLAVPVALLAALVMFQKMQRS